MKNHDVIVIPGIKLSLSASVSDAASLVSKRSMITDSDIHNARVSLKKARAILKLIRSQIQEDFYYREYETLKRSGSALCDLRENTVNRKLLRDIRKKSPAVFKKLNHPAIEKLIRKPERNEDQTEETLKILDNIGSSLHKSVYRIRFEPMGGLKEPGLMSDLDTTWSGVRDAYLACRNEPSAKRIHEFRKRAKDFLYQLAFFRPLNPSRIRSLQKKTVDMTHELGKNHDLAVLLKAIGYKYTQGNDPYLDELAVLIRGEQDRALMHVWPAARSLFGPSATLMDILRGKKV